MAYNENMKSKTDNVISNGMNLYGSESTISFNYYNGGVSVRICPIKPESERTPKSMYDYNTHTSIIIPKDDCLYLSWMLNNVFLPKMHAGESYFQGIRIGRANMISFDTGSAKSDGLPVVTIYRDLDPATLRAKESRRFVFRPVTTLSEYDPDAGNYTPDKHNDMDVIKMSMFFEQSSALCGAAYHSYRFEHRFAERASRKLTNSIAGKLGIAQDHPVNADQGFGYGGGFDNVQASPSASIASADDIAIEHASDVSSIENLV